MVERDGDIHQLIQKTLLEKKTRECETARPQPRLDLIYHISHKDKHVSIIREMGDYLRGRKLALERFGSAREAPSPSSAGISTSPCSLLTYICNA